MYCSARAAFPILPSSTMIWILVICLLVDGGESTETKEEEQSTEPEHYPDSILKINKNVEAVDLNGNRKQLFEGDILKRSISSYSANKFLWSRDAETVIIPYNISKDYGEDHRSVIFQAFNDLEATTCIRFIERTIQKDYIYIFPGIGCYANVGRVGKIQPVSLAFECVLKGKGVVMHELLHVIGFWHEHSRDDRDDYVTIKWSALDKRFLPNFCKYPTTNMIVKYDIGSLLHYSSLAFSKYGAQTIVAKVPNAIMGQRSELSASDIRRVNKLYKCSQYVASPDDSDVIVIPGDVSSEAICPDSKMADSVSSANDLASTENMVSLDQKQSPVSSPPSKEFNTGQDVLYSSAPVSNTVFSKESTSVVNGFMYSSTQIAYSSEDLTMPNGDATLEYVTTNAPESMQFQFTVSIPHRSTEQPPKRTAAPESIHEDNSTVLNTTKATEQLPGDHSTAFTTISAVGSSVTNSELIFRITPQSAPELFHSTAWLKAGINPEEKETKHSTTEEAIPKIHSTDSTMTASTIREGSSTQAVFPTSIYVPKRTMSNVDIVESHTTLHTSASYQSSEKQEQTTAEDTESCSGSGETPNASHEDHEYVKENLPKVARKRSLDWKTLGSWSEHHPRWIQGYKLTPSSKKSSNSSLIIEPFCGFEHGFCGWKQSQEDDLDWRLGWRNLKVNAGPFGPEGFHLSLKHSPEKSVLGQKALLLRPLVQPSNCISFWYGWRNGVKGTLNVYITSSGGEQTLLWSSGGQDHAKWTKVQIMLPPPLLRNHAHVVLEGVLGPSYRSNIAIDDLYVGQCS